MYESLIVFFFFIVTIRSCGRRLTVDDPFLLLLYCCRQVVRRQRSAVRTQSIFLVYDSLDSNLDFFMVLTSGARKTNLYKIIGFRNNKETSAHTVSNQHPIVHRLLPDSLSVSLFVLFSDRLFSVWTHVSRPDDHINTQALGEVQQILMSATNACCHGSASTVLSFQSRNPVDIRTLCHECW